MHAELCDAACQLVATTGGTPFCETLRPFTDSGSGTYGVAFTITKTFQVRWYAILSIIGYITAIAVFFIVLRWRYRVHVDPAFYFLFLGLPMALFGARIWSCILGNSHWSQFFDIQTAGMAVEGGIVLTTLAGAIYFPLVLKLPRYHKRVVVDGKVYIQQPSTWIYADAIVPTVLLGQAIGRWGNYFNGTIFGHAVSAQGLAWLHALMPTVFAHMQCVCPNPAPGLVDGAYYQPLFLYSSFANILAFIVLYLILPPFKNIRVGVVASLYYVFYGVIRFILESQRMSFFHFTGTYIINAFILVGGLISFIIAQWVAPKLRPYEMWRYIWYVGFKHWRIEKESEAFNWRHPVEQWISTRNLKDFTRTESTMIYYADR